MPSTSQLQSWVRARARLTPELLNRSAPWVRGVFAHSWAPMQALERQLTYLPEALWDYLLGIEGGYVAIHPGDSGYQPGPARLRHQAVRNVAYVSVEDLAQDNERPLHVVGHLVDHHLGCGGEEQGLWLSDGGGLEPHWRTAGQRLARLYDLGYGIDETAQSNVRDYFAQSLALYCRDRRQLNIADPQIEKWLRNTLWSRSFWRAADRSQHSTLDG